MNVNFQQMSSLKRNICCEKHNIVYKIFKVNILWANNKYFIILFKRFFWKINMYLSRIIYLWPSQKRQNVGKFNIHKNREYTTFTAGSAPKLSKSLPITLFENMRYFTYFGIETSIFPLFFVFLRLENCWRLQL